MTNSSRTSEFFTGYLNGCKSLFNGHIIYYDHVNSTMEKALELAREDAPEGTVILTDEQREGRGRRGRQWVSVPGGSLIFSIILREEELFKHVVVAASVAVLHAIRNLTGLKVTIKWPNDILVRRRKVAGLLLEQQKIAVKKQALILGIGVNVNLTPRDFYGPLVETATSLFMETGIPYKPAGVLKSILQEFGETYAAIKDEKGINTVLTEYNIHSELIDHKVTIKDDKRVVEGIAEKLGLNGELCVRTDSVIREILYTGEVVRWE